MVRVHSYGIPQPWCSFTAMEFRSHGARSQLWNSAAMVRVHSYGKPQHRMLHRLAMEFHGHGGRTQLWNPRAGANGQWRRVHPPLPGGQANPVRPGTCALFAQFLYDRSFPSPALACAWQRFSARLTILSLGTKIAVRTGRRKSWRRIKNSICSKLARFT
jgi:hypothetical protein